ncbi:MAG: hypothetical protein L6R39_003248 [Caloplaca ligustica]|nr:MAG: hypothetical protein L6R39_003248 [Caloplaca ligustica]
MSTRFSTYRDSINKSLGKWPELSWLNRLLQTPKPADGDETTAQIFDLVGSRFCASDVYRTAELFSQGIETKVRDSWLRLVLVGHGQSWDVDRDMIDVACDKFDVDPRFLAKHFDYLTIKWEKRCPPDIRSAFNNYSTFTDGDFHEDEHFWDLTSDILSALSMRPGSCFFFAYEDQCLSLAIHPEDENVTHGESSLDSGQQTWRVLNQLIKDLQEFVLFYHGNDNGGFMFDLQNMNQAQVKEAKEAKETSAKLGRLSQLAYIFLPLQLTASAMGMNLKNFGTGNIELRTFMLMLAIIAALSFAPVLLPILQGKRVSQLQDIARYSRRAGYLFTWFCLFHRRKTNDQLWDCGIEDDVAFFKGEQSKRDIRADVWAERRANLSTALRSPPFTFFPIYWQGVLDELHGIIDSPQWGRKVTSHHTA